MTKKFIQQWLLFAFLFYILMGFTSGRFFTYSTDQSRIFIDILISIFPSFILAFPLAYLSTKFMFKTTSFSQIYPGEILIYKRILANIIDFIVVYFSLSFLVVPVVILYFSKTINVYAASISLLIIMIFLPILYFSFCWSKSGTIGYKVFKLSLTFNKKNYIFRAIVKIILLPFTICSLILIFISTLSSGGKKNLLDFMFDTSCQLSKNS